MLFIVILPIIILLIFTIIDPKESFLFGRRWQFNGDVEPSETVLKLNRIIAIIALILFIVGFISTVINI